MPRRHINIDDNNRIQQPMISRNTNNNTTAELRQKTWHPTSCLHWRNENRKREKYGVVDFDFTRFFPNFDHVYSANHASEHAEILRKYSLAKIKQLWPLMVLIYISLNYHRKKINWHLTHSDIQPTSPLLIKWIMAAKHVSFHMNIWNLVWETSYWLDTTLAYSWLSL